MLGGLRALSLSGDQERLREAIDNLVGNAIKYSPIGGAIECRRHSSRGRGRLRGPATRAPACRPRTSARLFGRFQRLSAKPTAGEGSTGLGLVHRQAHRRAASAAARPRESAGPGQGSDLLALPIPRQIRRTGDMSVGTSTSIVVDDETAAREMVGDYLKMHGFEVTLCDGGASLRQRMATAAPDLDRARPQHARGGRALDRPRPARRRARCRSSC